MADKGVRVKLDLSDFVEGAFRFRCRIESYYLWNDFMSIMLANANGFVSHNLGRNYIIPKRSG